MSNTPSPVSCFVLTPLHFYLSETYLLDPRHHCQGLGFGREKMLIWFMVGRTQSLRNKMVIEAGQMS
jgi:hypothetical protein